MASSLKKSIQIARRNQHITPRLNGWLVRNPSGIQIHDRKVAKRVAEMMKPPKVAKGRDGAFHPSQLYQCQRAQVFGFLNAPTAKSYNPTLMNLFNDGHYRHLRWQVMLLSAGIITDVEVPVSIQELRLEGSMDGLNRDEGWMFELKGTSQFKTIQRSGALPAHIRQVHAYLLAADLERAIVVYECKSSQDWTEIEVRRNEETIKEIQGILETLNYHIDNDSLPEVQRDCKNQTGEYNGCPYATFCLGVNSTEQVTALIQVGRRASIT